MRYFVLAVSLVLRLLAGCNQTVETHCRSCGDRLEVRNLSRPRVGGLLGRRQSQADTVCPGSPGSSSPR